MKSKLTLLSLFLAATLITSQVSAAEEKTTTVDPVATADKSPDKTTDTTIDKSTSTDTTAPDSDEELVGGMSWKQFLQEVATQLAGEITKEITTKKFKDIQDLACKQGAPGSKGCYQAPFSLRSCGGIACRTGVPLINTAIIALCGDRTDLGFMSSTCVKNMPSGTEKDYQKARTTLCETSSSQYPFVEDVKKILKKAEICPSK